jgi:hypothetical protein
MAHKHFTDSTGTEWFAFDVTPRADDRRSYDRRRSEPETGKVVESQDRRGNDRRVTVGGQHPPRLTQGWLCFEREGERRRLQPVPENWTSLSDSDLEKLLASARVAPSANASTTAPPRSGADD